MAAAEKVVVAVVAVVVAVVAVAVVVADVWKHLQRVQKKLSTTPLEKLLS